MGKILQEEFQKEKQTISKETYKGGFIMFNMDNIEIGSGQTKEEEKRQRDRNLVMNLCKMNLRFDTRLVTKKELDDYEDRNEHNLVAIKLAKSFGTYQEVLTVMKIFQKHTIKGSIEHEDQKVRDQIIIKYYKLAK